MTDPKDRMSPLDAERCLTPTEVAGFLQTSLKTLARWRSSGTGPPFLKLKKGNSGSIRYPYRLYRDWLAEQICKPKATTDSSFSEPLTGHGPQCPYPAAPPIV